MKPKLYEFQTFWIKLKGGAILSELIIADYKLSDPRESGETHDWMAMLRKDLCSVDGGAAPRRLLDNDGAKWQMTSYRVNKFR